MIDPALLAALPAGELRVEGVITTASNITTRVLVLDDAATVVGRAVYKPVAGERPLWDFPDGTLAAREVTAHLVSRAGGWDVVPLTVLRDGPLGRGSVQAWVEDEDADDTGDTPGTASADGLVDLLTPEQMEHHPGWLPVLTAQDADGDPLVVAHRDDPDLADLAALDVVLNNADRKAAHLTRDRDGDLWAFDHGLTCHVEPKLRTLLWGWAGEALPMSARSRLEQLDAVLDTAGSDLPTGLLAEEEAAALRRRTRGLLRAGTFPPVPPDRTAIPWPLW